MGCSCSDPPWPQAIDGEVEKCPAARRLQTHPGVGPLTALAFVLIIGNADRFQCGKQIASYLGLVPLERSSGNQRRLEHITKQGNSLLRFLLVEAAQVTVRSRRGRKIAKVAMARKLAVRLYWTMRKEWDCEQFRKFGSHAGQPGRRWCEINIEKLSGHPAPLHGGVRNGNHDRKYDRRDAWVELSSDLKRITSGPWLVWQDVQLERNGALFGVHGTVCSKST
jgi:hypothetical protein